MSTGNHNEIPNGFDVMGFGICTRFLKFFVFLAMAGVIGAGCPVWAQEDEPGCDPGKWQELDKAYQQALSSGDYEQLRALRSQKESLRGCTGEEQPGNQAGETPSGGETPGSPSPGGDSPETGDGGTPAGPEPETPTTTDSGTPTEPGTGTPGGPEPGDTASAGTDEPPAEGPADAKAREEWDQRQALLERLIREKAGLEEVESSPLSTMWRDFWDSIANGAKPVPVEPFREPSFQELLNRGDPAAVRLQQLRDAVGDGVPTPEQLAEIRALSEQIQRGHAAAGTAVVNTNVNAATLARASEIISQLGASVGQAAAEAALIEAGFSPAAARAAAGAVYEGLQHYDEGVTGVVKHGAVGAASNVLGGAAGDKLQGASGAVTGAVGGAVGGATAAVGNAAVEGRVPTAGEVALGGAIGGTAGALVGGVGDRLGRSAGDDAAAVATGVGDDIRGPTPDGPDGSITSVDGPSNTIDAPEGPAGTIKDGGDGPWAVAEGPDGSVTPVEGSSGTVDAPDGPGGTVKDGADGPWAVADDPGGTVKNGADGTPVGDAPTSPDGPDSTIKDPGTETASVDDDVKLCSKCGPSSSDPVIDAVRKQIDADPKVANGHFIAMPESRIRDTLSSGSLEPTASAGTGSGFDAVYATNRGIPPAHTYPDGTHVVRIDSSHTTSASRVDYSSGQVFDGQGNPLSVPPDSLVLIPGAAGSGQRVFHVRPDGRLSTSIPSRFLERWSTTTNRFEPIP